MNANERRLPAGSAWEEPQMNTDEVGFGGACRLVLLGRWRPVGSS